MSSNDTPTPTGTLARGGAAHIAFGITALLAWFGMVVNFILTLLGTYPSLNTVPTLLGPNADGLAGLPGRVFDFLTYFTVLSNVTVAVVMTLLWRDPNRRSTVFRTVYLSALVMISVTGLIYGVVLAGSAKLQGLEHLTNVVEHYLVPLAAIIVFIVFGPRGLFRIGTVFAALILPIGWAFFALIRGRIIGAYPYNFLDVATLGLGTVLQNTLGVAILGIILGLIYLGIDRLRIRFSR